MRSKKRRFRLIIANHHIPRGRAVENACADTVARYLLGPVVEVRRRIESVLAEIGPDPKEVRRKEIVAQIEALTVELCEIQERSVGK